MALCMNLVLTASRAQGVPVSGGKLLKLSQTSTARAAGRQASQPETRASQPRASQGSQRVTINFSTFLSIVDCHTSLPECMQGKATAPRKALKASASQTASASQGKAPSSSQSSQQVTKTFSTFRSSIIAL